MDEKCKDCAYIKNAQGDIDRLRADVKNIYDRIGDVEVTVARKDEQITTIFKTLQDIKLSIEGVNDKLEVISKNAVDSKRLAELEEQVEELKGKPNSNEFEDLKKDVEEIKMKPVETFNKTKLAITTSVWSAIVGAILGFVFSKLIK